MRILITGGGGFIGSHLYEALANAHEVTTFDNFLTGRRQNNIAAAELDITHREQLYAFANEVKPELIIHCAASYDDPMKWHRDTQINVEGAINVAAMARHHDARVIYFQTILPPVSSYAISKIAAEHYLRIAGMPLTVFRLANVYGPRNLSGPVPVFYKRLTNEQPCTIVDTTRDFIFIEDVVAAVLRTIDHGEEGTFDVCSGRQTSIAEVFKLIAFNLGIENLDPPIVPPGPDDVQGFISPRMGVPGWRAAATLREGIAMTVRSYHENPISDTYTHLKLKG